MARPQTDIDATKQELLDIVEAMVAKRGAVEITVNELAAEAGMSPSNLYRFFENKEAILEAAAERWFAPKIAIMEEVVALPLPAHEKLYQFFVRRYRLSCQQLAADPQLFQSYMELGAQHFEVVRGYVDLGDHYLAIIVAEAMEQGFFTDLTIDETVSLIN
ncbi:TetR family transcriptional regulator, partial [Sphingorhabdus sp.]